METTELERWYTRQELAAHWNKSPKTLAAWSCKGYGPAYIKIGNRTLYAESAVKAFEASQGAIA